jgi:tricorn protease
MMRMKTCFAALLLLSCLYARAQQPLWLRYPAISPDGKQVAFGYKGDIYLVSSSGGTAVPLTIHEAQDMMPVWSRDGKYIAFASDRYGNFDVFLIPATGGEPTRLTYASQPDYPYDFTPDNRSVLFGSPRMTTAKSVRYYSPRLFQNLYTVPVTGGRSLLVTADGAEYAHYNPQGTQLVFQDRKGYEDPWRKHQASSVTRDIWTVDLKTNQHTKLTTDNVEDREPVYSNDGQYVYYLSEKNGNQNIYKKPLLLKIAEQQLTSFKTNPVRHLSVSKNNTLCFTYDGEIYTLTEGGQPQKLAVRIMNDGRASVKRNMPVNGNIAEFALSPNNKEIAFITHGEVFVTSVEGSFTKRITNTPGQERMLAWSPDSKTLYYSGERDGSWNIYQAVPANKTDRYFYAATVIRETPVIATPAEEFQPRVSPDGKEIAYLENRNIVKVFNLATKKSRTILPEGRNYSYSDGDQYFEWSPDSRWLVVNDEQGSWQYDNAALIKADGSQTVYPVKSGFGEGRPKFALDGRVLLWTSSKLGRKSLAMQGSKEVDIYGVFFDQEVFDKYLLSKDEYALQKEEDDRNKKDTAFIRRDSLAKINWKPDLKNLDNKQLRLTINSASISDYELSPDGSKLYYLAAFEKGYDLWVTEPRTHETKILAKLNGSPSGIEMSKDGKTLFLTNNGSLLKVDDAGKASPLSISSDLTIDADAERSYIFEHAWRQVKAKFYDPTIHGIDWEGFKNIYAKFLPHISNNYDFQELLSELLGELNASHTGGRYNASNASGDQTAALGIIPDQRYAGNGIRVDEVIVGGPFDKAKSKLKAGDIIEQINGQPIGDSIDWSQLLNRQAGRFTQISIYSPAAGKRWEETVKPISFAEENRLMYTRWTNRMAAMVDSLSNGKIGYVHVEGMNDLSYREVVDKVMGRNRDKLALIVDTRFNGGGWLHDDLNTFLSGKRYLDFAPQGHRVTAGESASRWYKPSCVLTSEGNYSDAFIFPYIYKQNGLGKVIGMPVPGTGTAVWWETQIDPTIIFGIPMVATIGKENRPTENLQLEPDIKVELPYESFLNGRDTQLEAAVKEMLQAVKQ